jgi:predicted  nucleic acid-binding Zn-ribbon protein
MAFTVQDLDDLLLLLEKHPEWKERLRQALLTEELLRLPQAVRDLIVAVEKLTAEIQRLHDWQERANAQMAEMLQSQRQVNERLAEIAEWQRQVNEQLSQFLQWQQRVNERLAEIAEWQRQVNEQLSQFLQWQQQVNERLAEIAEWQRQTNEEMRQILERLSEMIRWQQEMVKWQERTVEWQQRADRDFAKLKGSDREWYYRLRAAAVFGIFVLNGRDPTNEVMRKLHEAVKAGVITRSDLKAVRDADCLWLGEYEGKPVLLVVEASYTVTHEDLVRAVHRAEIARKIGYCAVPVVGGAEVSDEIWEQGRLLNAIVMKDGETDFDFAEQILAQAVQQTSP